MVREPKEQKINVFPLGELLLQAKTQEDIQKLTDLLSSFSCSQDKDIEDFLHNRSIDFERVNKSRTYILCDNDILRKEDRLVILGYFSVALKVLNLKEDVSNQTRKKLDGISAKLRGDVINAFPCYLIGQLAKNSIIPHEQSIGGAELIEQAISVIRSAEKLVGGRCVLIECHDNPKLVRFYNDNGFKELCRIPFGDITMVQMIRTLCSATL